MEEVGLVESTSYHLVSLKGYKDNSCNGDTYQARREEGEMKV